MTPTEEFRILVNSLNTEQWWNWVKTWLDPELISDICENWTDEVCLDEIPKLRKILKIRK